MIVLLTYPTFFLLVFPNTPLFCPPYFLFFTIPLIAPRQCQGFENTTKHRTQNLEPRDKTINILTETLELAYRRVNIAQHNLHTPKREREIGIDIGPVATTTIVYTECSQPFCLANNSKMSG